jgi:hypothetical protein
MSPDIDFDHQYPPAEWSEDQIATALTVSENEFPIPRYEDEETWEDIASHSLTEPVVDRILTQADDLLDSTWDRTTATDILEVYRTGNSDHYRIGEQQDRITTYALAECFEREGRYLDPLTDLVWDLTTRATWLGAYHLNQAWNDHLNMEGLPRPAGADERPIDLNVANTAQQLAELDYVLGDALNPALRERIRHAVDYHVFDPYLARDDFWWFSPPANNWNAVCNNGVLSAALYLESDEERLAEILAKGLGSLQHYINGFDRNGCGVEGLGYWNYGVRKYTELAANLEARTDGRLSLVSAPILEEIAKYPRRVELSPGRVPAYSDGGEETTVNPYAAAWLGRRLNLQWLAARGRASFAADRPYGGELQATLRNLTWCSEVPAEWSRGKPPEEFFFDGHDWWVVRDDPDDPDGLALATKGGTNNEPHNHNDCGTFVVHYRGESLLTDLGGESYAEDYFSSDRYEYLAARSLGHSVPYVNGYEQAPGGRAEHLGDHSVEQTPDSVYAASVVDRDPGGDAPAVEYELAGCYPSEAGLESLRRRFTFERGSPETVRVSDTAWFADAAPGRDLESVLVSYSEMESNDSGLIVTGENAAATIEFAPSSVDVDVERLSGGVKGNDVWRARVAPSAEPSDPVEIDMTVRLDEL